MLSKLTFIVGGPIQFQVSRTGHVHGHNMRIPKITEVPTFNPIVWIRRLSLGWSQSICFLEQSKSNNEMNGMRLN